VPEGKKVVMVAKNQYRIPLIVLVATLLISQGCGSSPTAVSTPVESIVTAPPEVVANVQIVVTAIQTKQPELLRSLIGEDGVAIAGFAQEVDFKGHNNADEIIAAFERVLEQSTPVCEGFVSYMGALPDKVILVYRNLELDWSQFGFGGTNSDGMSIQLFNTSDSWRLVFITPFNFERDLPLLGTLQACPAVSPVIPSPTQVFTETSSPTSTETAISSIPSITPEISNNELNLFGMNVQEWASTSPDGKWVAVGLVAFPKENIGGQQAYIRLMIFSADGKIHWMIFDKWEELNLGFPIPAPLKWSRDSKHFYFTHRVTPDGCSAFSLLTDLQQVNLADGTVTELLPQSAVTLALAPDQSQVAYVGQGDRGLILKDLVTGEERETEIDPGKEFDAGNIMWSPDGNALALTLAINPCTGEYGGSKTVWAESTSILRVDANTLQQRVLVEEDPRWFITWEWNEAEKITITDGVENSLWHLDVNTREITKP
jgi:hypothetical protein